MKRLKHSFVQFFWRWRPRRFRGFPRGRPRPRCWVPQRLASRSPSRWRSPFAEKPVTEIARFSSGFVNFKPRALSESSVQKEEARMSFDVISPRRLLFADSLALVDWDVIANWEACFSPLISLQEDLKSNWSESFGLFSFNHPISEYWTQLGTTDFIHFFS